MVTSRIGIRWTVGDASADGFEALRLSIWGAYRTFGDAAAYAICVNTVPLAVAKLLTGEIPAACTWHEVTGDPPPKQWLDRGMPAALARKLAPARMFHDRYEIALDNECILWALPSSIGRWIDGGEPSCLLLEAPRADSPELAGTPRCAAIRGFPPGFDLEAAMSAVLDTLEEPRASEPDEWDLSALASARQCPLSFVSLVDVARFSPFPSNVRHLGCCGAHFVGLNARDLGWQLDGRPASSHVRAHWRARRPELYERVGLPLPDDRHARAASRARLRDDVEPV